MRKAMLWGLAVVFGVFLLVGRRIATPEPWAIAYHDWLVWSGAILGVLTGLCSGQLAASIASSAARGILGAAVIGSSLMVFQLAVYGILLPDFLTFPTGPQDNFEPWVFAGFYGLPLSVVVSLLSGWLFWLTKRR